MTIIASGHFFFEIYIRLFSKKKKKEAKSSAFWQRSQSRQIGFIFPNNHVWSHYEQSSSDGNGMKTARCTPLLSPHMYTRHRLDNHLPADLRRTCSEHLLPLGFVSVKCVKTTSAPGWATHTFLYAYFLGPRRTDNHPSLLARPACPLPSSHHHVSSENGATRSYHNDVT